METVTEVVKNSSEAVSESTESGSKTAAGKLEAAPQSDAETDSQPNSARETPEERAVRKNKRQADFSLFEFLGLVSAPEDTPDTSVVIENSQTNTEVTTGENSEATTTTTTSSTKMATESSSVVVEASARLETQVVDAEESSSVRGTGTPEEEKEVKPGKKGFASLGGAIDQQGGDSDNESDDEIRAVTDSSVTTSSERLMSSRETRSETHQETVTSNTEVEETEEEIITTTTTTKTITTTTVINSDGEEEEVVEEVTVVTDENGNVLNETSVVIGEESNAEGDPDETTGGASFWSRMNDKAERHPDSDSD